MRDPDAEKTVYIGTEELPDRKPKAGFHLVPGTLLKGRYEIGTAAGSGGFGITYRARDRQLDSPVAVKEYFNTALVTRIPGDCRVTLLDEDDRSLFDQGKKSFLEEASRLAQLRSEPGIVHVYDCFEENGTAYIIMEFLTGETLGARLRREGRLPVRESMRITEAVLEGLVKVHAHGMLHRDIAPDNIFLLTDGTVKLFDFGSARVLSRQRMQGLTVEIKPGYSPVEQYRSHGDQGPWTDVYAAAATCYRMLTGEIPRSSLERQTGAGLKPPSAEGIRLPAAAERALMNALATDPARRTRSAAVFLEDLRGKKKNRRLSAVPAVLAATAAAGLVLAAAGGLRAGTAGEEAAEAENTVPAFTATETAGTEESVPPAQNAEPDPSADGGAGSADASGSTDAPGSTETPASAAELTGMEKSGGTIQTGSSKNSGEDGTAGSEETAVLKEEENSAGETGDGTAGKEGNRTGTGLSGLTGTAAGGSAEENTLPEESGGSSVTGEPSGEDAVRAAENGAASENAGTETEASAETAVRETSPETPEERWEPETQAAELPTQTIPETGEPPTIMDNPG